MNRKLVVLIVEDHPGVRDTLERMVESWLNVDMLSCAGFLAAATWIASAPRIDLLIGDVCLPGEMTGVDVADMAVKTFPQIAVLMISADPRSQVAGLSDRYAFIRKPFDRTELIRQVEIACRRFTLGPRTPANDVADE